jgi:hypothetical protein
MSHFRQEDTRYRDPAFRAKKKEERREYYRRWRREHPEDPRKVREKWRRQAERRRAARQTVGVPDAESVLREWQRAELAPMHVRETDELSLFRDLLATGDDNLTRRVFGLLNTRTLHGHWPIPKSRRP